MSTYNKNDVCFFSKAKDQWGEFGNMTGGFKFRLTKDILIPSSENLYQAMRFPEYPEIQKAVIEQKSGFGSKMVSKKYRKTHTFEGFEEHKIDIMLWCLQLKALNHKNFRDVLLSTGTKTIVELSNKDSFWGAIPISENSDSLVGTNTLGQLLMFLREEMLKNKLENKNDWKLVIPPEIDGFNFYGNPVPIIDLRGSNNEI
jgi:ribA/ribD-fused uncharacterized protein